MADGYYTDFEVILYFTTNHYIKKNLGNYPIAEMGQFALKYSRVKDKIESAYRYVRILSKYT